MRNSGTLCPPRRRRALLAGIAVGTVLLSSCGTSPSTTSPHPKVVRVVAAENFWGSIASQIGGSHVSVTSIITNPTIDPHAYEPTTADAIALASAQVVIENGIGYDPWVPRLLSADQSTPTVLDVGTVLGVANGGNPHRWYNPADVQQVISSMVTDFQRIDPAASAYFAAQATHFNGVDLRPYHLAITAIRSKYAGTKVGASESIFAMLAPSLGLDLVTPSSFLRAVSEGTEVSAADKQTIDHQIKAHLIKVYVYNSQNVTPDVQAQLTQVKAEHIPYATITETLVPPTSTYEAWQTAQLLGIEAALARAVRSRP